MLAVELLFPPDPGALRLYAALRATLAGVLTFFLVLLLGNVIALPVTDRILGFAMALFIAANVRDGTRQQRLITIALAPLFAFVATTLAALLFDRPIAAATLLPLIMFVVAYGAQRGPRWASLGIVALIAYFFGIVTHDPPATLPMRLVVLLLAAGDAALIRCLLLPERPRAELDRLRRAIHAGIVRVLDRIAAAVTVGNWTGPAREELHRNVYRLDDVVMLAQARVAALAAELPGQGSDWLHLLAIELGVERVARIAQQDLGTPADRGPLLATLNALRQDFALPSVRSTATLGGALALLARVMREAPQQGPAQAAAPPPAGAAPGIRSALQTAAASALAIVAGDLVCRNRWYWAAFAAFVMFQGTRSRGESLIKGTQFIIGTFAGVVFGMLVATLLSGHEILTISAIVVAVFLAFQANVAVVRRDGVLAHRHPWPAVWHAGLFRARTTVAAPQRGCRGCRMRRRRGQPGARAARACGGGRRRARFPAGTGSVGGQCRSWIARWPAGTGYRRPHPGSRTAIPRSGRDCAVRTVGTGRRTQ